MKRFSKIAAAAISLFASGTLLAQSVPPKVAPEGATKPATVTVAQAPAPGGASSGADDANTWGQPESAGTIALVVLGVVAVAAAAASGSGSSTTNH